MKKIIVILCGGCAILASSATFAINTPRPLATDVRIKVVPYEENNVVPVRATPFIATQIEFGKNEFIENIQNGDMTAWTVNVQPQLPYMLFIKPTILRSNTNLEVITNKHSYYFHLISSKQPTSKLGDQTYAIKFVYPKEVEAKLAHQLKLAREKHASMINIAKNPQAYNWNYSFDGAKQLIPLHVFDDGRFTFMQLRTNQSLPAVFAVDERSGKESVVNFRMRGSYLVIERVAPQFTLRSGKENIASIFNNKMIADLS